MYISCLFEACFGVFGGFFERKWRKMREYLFFALNGCMGFINGHFEFII